MKNTLLKTRPKDNLKKVLQRVQTQTVTGLEEGPEDKLISGWTVLPPFCCHHILQMESTLAPPTHDILKWKFTDFDQDETKVRNEKKAG